MNHRPSNINHLRLMASLSLLICFAAVFAVAGEDEAKFLRVLKERGYDRLVEVHCRELLEDANATPQQKAIANKELGKVALRSAEEAKSLDKRVKFLKEAAERFSELGALGAQQDDSGQESSVSHNSYVRTFDLGTSLQELGLALLNQFHADGDFDPASIQQTDISPTSDEAARSKIQDRARDAFDEASRCFNLIINEAAKISEGIHGQGARGKNETVKGWIKRVKDGKLKYVYQISSKRRGRAIPRTGFDGDFVTVFLSGKPPRRPVTLKHYDDFLEFNPFAAEVKKRRTRRTQREARKTNEPSVEEILMRSEYELATTYYYAAQIYARPKGPLFARSVEAEEDDALLRPGQMPKPVDRAPADSERERLLKDAIIAFGEFTWKHEKDLLSLDAYIGKAVCYRELGECDKAMDIFDMIAEADLPSQTKPGAIGVKCAKQAYCERAVTMIQAGKREEAVKSADSAINLPYQSDAENAKEIEQWENKARLVKIEGLLLLSKDLLAKGDFSESQQGRKEAASTARNLVESGGYWRTEVCELVAAFCGALPKGEKLYPFERFALAETLFNKRQYAAALPLYKETASNADPLIAAASSFKIGLSSFKMGQDKKAADAFAAVADKYPDAPLAKDAAYYGALCYGKHYNKTGDAADRRAYIASLRDFVAKFPNHERADDAQWFLANAIERNPDASSDSSPDGGFEAAAEELRKIGPRSKHYPEARLAIARCLEKHLRRKWEQGQTPEQTTQLFDSVVKELTDFASWAKRQARRDKRQRAKFDKLAGDAEFMRSRLYVDAKQPDKAIELLRDFDKRYAGQRGLLFKSLYVRLSADLQQGRLRDAELKLKEMLEKYPDANQKDAAITQLASAFEKDAQKAYKIGNKSEADAYLQKAVYVYEVRLKNLPDRAKKRGDVAARTKFKIAEGYARLERWLDARPYYEELSESNPRAVNVLERLATCYEQTKKYAEALKVWRNLGQLLRPGSPEWFEAKYHLIWTHYRLGNTEEARKILDVTRTLHPKLGGPELKTKFDELERRYKR